MTPSQSPPHVVGVARVWRAPWPNSRGALCKKSPYKSRIGRSWMQADPPPLRFRHCRALVEAERRARAVCARDSACTRQWIHRALLTSRSPGNSPSRAAYATALDVRDRLSPAGICQRRAKAGRHDERIVWRFSVRSRPMPSDLLPVYHRNQ